MPNYHKCHHTTLLLLINGYLRPDVHNKCSIYADLSFM